MSTSFGSGFRAIDHAASPDALLEFLDSVASVPALQEIKEEATRNLGIVAGDHVLDIGCGTGVDLPYMLERAGLEGRVVGIDSSARAVAAASERLSASRGISIDVADVHELPYPDGTFDAARADRVFLHLARPEHGVAETFRVLRPGGRLVILETWAKLEGTPELVGSPVHRALRTSMWEPGEQQARIELFLPVILAQVGFEPPVVEEGLAWSSDFADADAMLRLRPSMHYAVAAGELSTEDGEAWLTAVEHAMGAEDVRLRLGFVRFATRRPG